MSFLKRIQARTLGHSQTVRPKGFARRAVTNEIPAEEEAQPLRREENKDEKPDEKVQPLRRAEAAPVEEENEPLAQSLRRQGKIESEEKPEETEATPLRRAALEHHEEEAQALRREEKPEQENLQAVKRQSTEPEPEPEQEPPTAQTMRRAETEAPEEEQAAQPMRRATLEHNEEEASPLRRIENEDEKKETADVQPSRAPSAMNLSAENSEPAEQLNEEPPEAIAAPIRRDINTSFGVGADSAVSNGWLPNSLGVQDSQPNANEFTHDNNQSNRVETSAKPTLQIDQIDVLVQEPVATRGFNSAPNNSRAIRTRYLRRL